jgi:hypothetical protein
MFIEVVDVNRSDAMGKNGKSYGVLQVAYRADGKMQEKKLMSFSNPNVFKHIEKMSKGESVEVKTEKDQNGYWQWTAIGDAASAQSTPSATGSSQATPTRVTGSTYETKEERAVKQRYIVRQSSLSNAIDSLSIGAKSALSPADVIAVAKQFEEWVFSENSKPALDAIVEDLSDDIPY